MQRLQKQYNRGDIYYADLGTGIGSEQNGYRPVVIIQNDVGNKFSPTTIVAMMTSRVNTKANLPTHMYLPAENGLPQPSMLMLEQLRTIDKSRLGRYIGSLDEVEVDQLNRALAVSIGLMASVPERKPVRAMAMA